MAMGNSRDTISPAYTLAGDVHCQFITTNQGKDPGGEVALDICPRLL